MVAARRRSASSGPLRGLQRHVRRRARSCVQSNLPAMPTIGEGGLIPPISGQSPRKTSNLLRYMKKTRGNREQILEHKRTQTEGMLRMPNRTRLTARAFSQDGREAHSAPAHHFLVKEKEIRSDARASPFSRAYAPQEGRGAPAAQERDKE